MNNNGQIPPPSILLNQQNAQWQAFQKFGNQPQPLMLQSIPPGPPPVPLMLISPQIQTPQRIPLVQFNQPIQNPNQTSLADQNFKNDESGKNQNENENFNFKIYRYDLADKNIESLVEDYFGESIKNLRNLKSNNSEDSDISNVNIEIQTTDFNHGLSASSTIKIKLGTFNQKSKANSQSLLLDESDSLQTAKIPTIDQKTTKTPSSNLFPILNETKTSSNNNYSSSNKSIPIQIENILHKPGRDRRPHKILIIFRGPPGSGKSFLANLIKKEEEKFVSSSDKPKLLSIDNYFITEQENENSVSSKTQLLMKYEYDESLNEAYQRSLIKSFKKLIDDDLFNFIIVDMINEKLNKIEEISVYAKQRGFQIYIAELNKNDAQTCFNRNVHNRSLAEINKIIENWEPLPDSYSRLDLSFFIQNQEEIEQVEMDEGNTIYDSAVNSEQKSSNENENTSQTFKRSKWESNENSKRLK